MSAFNNSHFLNPYDQPNTPFYPSGLGASSIFDIATEASRTLFIGDLSYFCTEDDLTHLFTPYGPILTVRIRRGVTGDSLMHGFMALSSAEAAQQAIKDMNGLEYMGRNLK
jgi:RNA recognition motif-containing protein